MKKFLAFIICMTVIPALILACAAGFLYNKYFSPTAIEYDFLRGEEQICSIEYVSVSFADGNVTPEHIGTVKDTNGFISDILGLECYKGITLESFKALSESSTVNGFVINYMDESFEVITPYVCLNSDLDIKEIPDLLKADVYGFDSAAIFSLLEKYKISDGVGI